MPSSSHTPSTIPITVFTGFLGAGKTSIILSLLPQLPKGYRVVLLKNEFGDIEVDSQLAKQSSLTAVSEILNGCMCCVLVGQMKTALLEILEKYHPDRIIIESSGSAFPATLAFQIRDLERETSRALSLDAIVTVIDAENFTGYEDTSVTARMQAQYTDVLLINKWEHISERALDDVLDHLNTLNEDTPKIRCTGKSVDPALIFGIDSKMFRDDGDALPPPTQGEKGDPTTAVKLHHDEVETVTLLRGAPTTPVHVHVHNTDSCDHPHHSRPDPHPEEPTTAHAAPAPGPLPLLDESTLSAALHRLPKDCVYRVKGFICFSSTPTATATATGTGTENHSLITDIDAGTGTGTGTGAAGAAVAAAADPEDKTRQKQWWIVNWAFGRWELVSASISPVSAAGDSDSEKHGVVRLTVMGERGEVRRNAKRLADALGAAVVN